MVEYYEMIDGGESLLYHLFFYMISNFLIANVNEPVVYYYPNKKNCCVSEGFLSLLPSHFTRHLVKDPVIEYRTFMHAIPCFKDIALPGSYTLLRFLFKHHIRAMIPGRKIYIQRKNATKRTFLNETKVQSLLESLGYETIVLENYSAKEQIRILSESEYIIGAHGSGLSLTVFCNQKAKVVEIYGAPMTERKHYYHIAHTLKHSFFRFQDVDQSKEENEAMSVNTESLRSFLIQWHHPGLF